MHTTSFSAVFDKVVLAVEQTIFVEGPALTPATRLVDDLELGRFGRIKLAVYLEETFDVELTDEAVDRFDTVGDIVQYVSHWSHEGAHVSSRPPARS
jgi:acyl carrier protein